MNSSWWRELAAQTERQLFYITDTANGHEPGLHRGIQLSEHVDVVDGTVLFRHARAMGLEGIVSKRRDKPYRCGRSPDWIKIKNPDAPAATRVIAG